MLFNQGALITKGVIQWGPATTKKIVKFEIVKNSSNVFEINVNFKAIRLHGPQLKYLPRFQLFAEDVGTSTQTHTSHLDSCNTILWPAELKCCVTGNRVLVAGVVAYASQMLTNSTPETSPSFADVDMGTSAAGYTVHKIFRCRCRWNDRRWWRCF